MFAVIPSSIRSTHAADLRLVHETKVGTHQQIFGPPLGTFLDLFNRFQGFWGAFGFSILFGTVNSLKSGKNKSSKWGESRVISRDAAKEQVRVHVRARKVIEPIRTKYSVSCLPPSRLFRV